MAIFGYIVRFYSVKSFSLETINLMAFRSVLDMKTASAGEGQGKAEQQFKIVTPTYTPNQAVRDLNLCPDRSSKVVRYIIID